MSKASKIKTLSQPSRRGVLGLIAFGGLALSGCQVGPLYGDQVGFGAPSATAQALSGIAIDPPADRVTQLVRNELVFGLNSDASNAPYRLSMRASSASQSLGVTNDGASFAQSVQVQATYRLFQTGTEEPLLENTVFSTASYDTSGQRFSNQRARIDAERRAALEVARMIEAQLAAAFASGR